MTQEQEEWLVIRSQTLQFRYRNAVQILGFRAAAGFVRSPSFIVDITPEAACRRISCKSDAGRVVSFAFQQLSECRHVGSERSAVPERHDVGAEAIHAGQHRGVPGVVGMLGEKWFSNRTPS